MDLGAAFGEAFHRLFTFDPEVWNIIGVSLQVSLTAILLASLVGGPIGFIIGISTFRGKRVVTTILNTMMSIPTVIIGLVLYMLLSRSGPLGPLGLLFSPTAMILGQFLMALPLLTALIAGLVQDSDQRILSNAQGLGASRLRAFWTLFAEIRFGVMAAVAAAFGRVISEVGCAIMVGGNIKALTRTMTTSIALETSKGEFALGLALGLILLLVALGVNITLAFLRGK